jgi:hypothetical protein
LRTELLRQLGDWGLGEGLSGGCSNRDDNRGRLSDRHKHREGAAMRHFAGLDVSLEATAICVVDETRRLCRAFLPMHGDENAPRTTAPAQQSTACGQGAGTAPKLSPELMTRQQRCVSSRACPPPAWFSPVCLLRPPRRPPLASLFARNEHGVELNSFPIARTGSAADFLRDKIGGIFAGAGRGRS